MPTEAGGIPKLLIGTYPTAERYDADIIILTLNRLQETCEAVRSALGQRHVKVHISILDQGSTSENQTALADRIDGLSNISYFACNKNLGVGGGRNFLSSIGRGHIIVALDNDAIFSDEDVVQNAVRAFDKNPRLGAIGFSILSGSGCDIDHDSWGYPSALKRRFDEEFTSTTFVGAGHAIRRETWENVGGYDAALFFTWEEYDFCLRAIARGWTILYAGSLRVLHKTSVEERVRWTAGRARFFARNRIVIGRKWGMSWLFLLPRIVAYLANGAVNNHLWDTILGVLQAIAVDGRVTKRQMTRDMRIYIQKNELNHRGSLYGWVRAEIFRRRPVLR